MHLALFLLALVLFISLVLAHEWGHFIVAKRNGVTSEEFGLGFPPRLWGKKLKSGLLISLNALPLGGFVKLKGEHDNDKRPGSFGAASLGAKTRILLAGVGMNALVGLVLLTILAAVGIPVLITPDGSGQNQFSVKSDTRVVRQEVLAGYIEPGSPASRAGLRSTDTVVNISSAKLRSSDIKVAADLSARTKFYRGQNVSIAITRNGQRQNLFTRLRANSNGQGYLGVSPQPLVIQRSTWSAPVVAVGFAAQLVWLTLQGVGHAFGGLGSALAGLVTHNHLARQNGQTEASSQLGGPVAIGEILWNSGSLGLVFVVMFVAIISLTLALFNVLPIPALDGGRLAMILYSRKILKRPLSRASEEKFITVGMSVLMLLVILITIVDVKRSF